MNASSLTTALGRPIRDQVYSVRDTQSTTLQGSSWRTEKRSRTGSGAPHAACSVSFHLRR